MQTTRLEKGQDASYCELNRQESAANRDHVRLSDDNHLVRWEHRASLPFTFDAPSSLPALIIKTQS